MRSVNGNASDCNDSSAHDHAMDEPTHVVLYFDVNKTVIMHDPVQDKGLDHILNDLLAERALGHVMHDASGELQWIWNGESALRSFVDSDAASSDAGDALVSYGEFLRTKYPMSADTAVSKYNKRQRKLLRQDFTGVGFAGEALAAEHSALLAQLELPVTATDLTDPPTADALDAAGLKGMRHCFLLPAFLHVVHVLHTRGLSFNLVFRTFGDDLASVAREFNCFCSGRHPFAPLASSDRMDGTGASRIDRRIHLTPVVANESPRFGTFYRSDAVTALVLGTFDQPTDTGNSDSNDNAPQGLAFYDAMAAKQPIEIHTGLAAIHDVLTTRWRSQQATLALRDFYPFWFAAGQTAETGKLLPLDPQDVDTHAVFFDDNVLPHDAHIVDARNVRDGTSLAFVGCTQHIHVVRVEPLEAIACRELFVDKFDASLALRKQRQRQRDEQRHE